MNSRYIRTISHPTQNPRSCQTYTTYFFSKSIFTVVTATPAVARQWVYNLRNNHRDLLTNAKLVVGLGVQWTPPTRRNPNPPTAATIQLSVGRNCLIFQLSHANSVPLTLYRLLKDKRVTFVGVHNGMDKSRLQESWAELAVWDLVDLGKKEGYGNRSMEGICSDVLGLHGVSKPREVGFSNWDMLYLSIDQVQYACLDAHVSYLLGVEFGYPKFYDEDEEDYDDGGEYGVDYCDHGDFGCGYGGDYGGDYDDGDFGRVYVDDGDLDYEDYTNPYHYNSDWNYVGY
ncbi:uncharacterized protein LOC141609326 [Silene latifolia]|uniref:uncharacterized protein LOC141609326 n=1 Tax=Silene latifolia TaxID=37657 RepID=UPI003D770F29